MQNVSTSVMDMELVALGTNAHVITHTLTQKPRTVPLKFALTRSQSVKYLAGAMKPPNVQTKGRATGKLVSVSVMLVLRVLLAKDCHAPMIAAAMENA
mmetsp:Transcript_19197/g.31965  ORF Transcript_19197/g.31965 Transcript_19197/m.31965 type:complete len:98 (-) Transcript_19197:3001-3294(-)